MSLALTGDRQMTRKFQNVEIIRSDVTHADTGRKLYELRGEINKPAAVRPFLKTIREAEDYIDGEMILRERS